MFVDAAGLIHRSAPAYTQPVTVVGDAGPGPSLHITALSATWRDLALLGSVSVEIYRTAGNGSVFYFLQAVPVSGTVDTEIVWPPFGAPDTTLDADIEKSTLLYTTGGVLPNINPPTFLLQITHNGRVAGVDETLQQVWFSQAFSSGTAPGFSGSIVVPFPEGGDITAIASMDGKFIAFKQSSIWIMYGNNGPALTGQGSDWTVPQRIQTNVGAISQFGCCSTDVGIFFQSPDGIYLLGRDLSVSFIGAPVIDTIKAYPTITSATLVPSATHVRFTCSNGTNSVTVVYDYLLKQWTTHSYVYLTTPIQSSVLSYEQPQQFTMITQDGNIWQEQLPNAPQAWMDQDLLGGYHFVNTTVQMAWIKQGLQTFLRAGQIQLYTALDNSGAGTNMSGLQVQLATNYNPAVVQTGLWTAENLYELATPGQVSMYTAGAFNLSQAYQITLQDIDSGTVGQSGQGAVFLGLAMEIDAVAPRFALLPVLARQ
jgi:hypothetical protein